MDLVIDANVLISSLISTQGKNFDLIFNDEIELYAPEFLLDEFEKYKKEILSKSKLLEEDFRLFLSLISSRISFIPYLEFKKFVLNAKKITPDPKDMEYFALALKLNCGIWSNDKKLKKQNKVKVYSTKDLLEMF
jgi:predicted nucleic acid-binding protein